MKKKSTYLVGKTFYFLFLLCSFILIAGAANAQPSNQTFNTSGTYTVPSGYSAILTIEAWGAGAGGGAGSGAKGGGGSGAYASTTNTLTAGSYAVTIGTGGGNTGTNGGNSSFTTIVIAEGGFSTTTGTGGAGGTTGGSTGTTKIAGAAGANSAGSNGGAGVAGANGGGGGGTGGPANNGVGGTGTSPGGGGGGKAGPGNNGTGGGVGGNGRVIVTVNSVLPVRLSNIKAFEKQNGIQIEWTVSSEENLSRYQVERSSSGSLFTAIGDVASRNVTVETKYGFFDANPLPGVSFYRLKSIDIDSKYGYSSVVRVSLDKQVKNISLYPNPVTGGYVSFNSSDLNKGNYQVRVFNSSGAQVFKQSFSHSGGAINQTLKLPVGIQSGLYVLQLSNDGVKVLNKNFMIQ